MRSQWYLMKSEWCFIISKLWHHNVFMRMAIVFYGLKIDYDGTNILWGYNGLYIYTIDCYNTVIGLWCLILLFVTHMMITSQCFYDTTVVVYGIGIGCDSKVNGFLTSQLWLHNCWFIIADFIKNNVLKRLKLWLMESKLILMAQ